MDNLTLMIKPASSLCNLRCSYCFYEDVSLNREIKSYGMMSEDTIEVIVRKVFEAGVKQVNFGFQGGEPSLASDQFYEHFIRSVKKYNTNHAKVFYSFQTNGFVLSEALLKLMAREKFLVGVSLDGPQEIHDLNRKDASGKGSFKAIMKNIKRLKEQRIEFNILSVVNKAVVRHVKKVYDFYKGEDFRYLQFTPCVENFDGVKQPYMVSAKEFGEFLCRLFDLWYDDFKKGQYVSVRYFDNLIQMIIGMPPESCAMNGICSVNGIIEADGSVYPCDFYMLDQYRLGNIHESSFEELLQSPVGESFVAPSKVIDDTCRQCPYIRLCRGGCRRERERLEGQLGRNKLCDGYKMFFDYGYERLLEVAKTVSRR